MASPSHEDHSDLDSLFGDNESHDEYGIEIPKSQQRPVIQLPRAAATSQNVGTIAHSSVPSSTEHPHSSGPMSSASIPLTKDVVPGALPQGKRNASPGPNQPNKKRRVDPKGPKLGDKSKLSLANLGLAISPGQSLTSTKLQSVASLLAPSAIPSRGTSRGSKGKSNITHSVPAQAPVASGTGTATDPVIISDESPNQSASSALSTTARRLTRSQQARLLLDALPNDPSDVLSQTLRTILKNPTTAPHGRSSIPRDTAVYLANGRLTGTPFLRLLRYLAGPTRRTDPALGLMLLKKLVEAMRATEEMTSKAASAGQSSAASTPMPATPGTPSTASFPAYDKSGTFYSSESLESNLFSQLDLPPTAGLDGFSLPTIAEFDPAPATDIVIDPELLALSQDPAYLQSAPQSIPDLDFDFAELLGALPTSIPDWSASSPTPAPDAEPLPTDSTVSWDDLANIPFENIFETWLPGGQPPPVTESLQPSVTGTQSATPLLPVALNAVPQLLAPHSHPIPQGPKQNNHTPSTIRIPPRTEALALLERARTRKKELEAKIAFARRQLWGCKIEAGVERNLLEKLRKE